MSIEKLLQKINAIGTVTATYRDSLLTVRVMGFEPMFVDFDSQIYNAECLPPLPPKEEWYSGARSDVWHKVMNILKEYWSA